MNSYLAKKQKKNELDIYLKPRLLKILERTTLFMKVYRSGKIPKIIRILPSIKNFEEMLWLTRPDTWSNSAVYSITRSFLPKLDKKQMSRFFSLILAPRFQETIFQRKSYSIHVQKALKISTNYPSIFFSSIVLPICESKHCSMKEGVAISAILMKYRFPPKIIITVIVRLINNPVSAPKCIILKTIINKNYLLPLRIIDILVDFLIANRNKFCFPHFKMLFLSFIKNYSTSLSTEDKQKLQKVKF